MAKLGALALIWRYCKMFFTESAARGLIDVIDVIDHAWRPIATSVDSRSAGHHALAAAPPRRHKMPVATAALPPPLLLLLLVGALLGNSSSSIAAAVPERQLELEIENQRLRQLLHLSRSSSSSSSSYSYRPRWDAPNVGSLKGSKPNILIVFGDDVGYADLGAFGHPTARTPNLDHMAATGAKLTQCECC
jgi:hypothetical protein